MLSDFLILAIVKSVSGKTDKFDATFFIKFSEFKTASN